MKNFSEFSELQESTLKFKKVGQSYEAMDRKFSTSPTSSYDTETPFGKDEKWDLYYDDELIGFYRTKRDAVAAANNIAKEDGLL